MNRFPFTPGKVLALYVFVLVAAIILGFITNSFISSTPDLRPALTGLTLVLFSVIGRKGRFGLARWLLRLGALGVCLIMFPGLLSGLGKGVAIVAVCSAALLWFVETMPERVETEKR